MKDGLDLTGSKERLEALLDKNSASSSLPEPSTRQDPIAGAMAIHPKPTRETAERMAREFGF